MFLFIALIVPLIAFLIVILSNGYGSLTEFLFLFPSWSRSLFHSRNNPPKMANIFHVHAYSPSDVYSNIIACRASPKHRSILWRRSISLSTIVSNNVRFKLKFMKIRLADRHPAFLVSVPVHCGVFTIQPLGASFVLRPTVRVPCFLPIL